MLSRVIIEDEEVQAWVVVAHGSRLLQHCLRNASEPVDGSAFDRVAEIYPYERVSDRARAYLAAAVEHLIFWADVQAPLKFHPDQANEVTLRPSYTLARAAIEAAAQAVWMMNTTEPLECIRRHICLMRWDLQEFRKSKLDLDEKCAVKALEDDLVRRVSGVFSEEQVKPPNSFLDLIRLACSAEGLDLEADDAERLWRAASGAAHGKYWPTQDLQRVVSVEEEASGEVRSVRVPDVDGITEVLEAAHLMTQIGVLRFLDYSGVDIASALVDARNWVSEVIPLKEGASRDDLRERASALDTMVKRADETQ